MITHANVIPFIDWATSHFNYTPEDYISGHPPLHFDLSTLDVYGTSAAGAQLHLVSPKLNLLPHKIADLIRDRELTSGSRYPPCCPIWQNSTSFVRMIFRKLKRLLWCGKRFPTPALIYWMKRLPHVNLTNLYGPTEIPSRAAFIRFRSVQWLKMPPSPSVFLVRARRFSCSTNRCSRRRWAIWAAYISVEWALALAIGMIPKDTGGLRRRTLRSRFSPPL